MLFLFASVIIDRVAGEIMRLVASVCVRVSVRLFVCVCVCLTLGALLFEPFDFDFWRKGRP